MFQSELENARSLIQQKNDEIESINGKFRVIFGETDCEINQLQQRYHQQIDALQAEVQLKEQQLQQLEGEYTQLEEHNQDSTKQYEISITHLT